MVLVAVSVCEVGTELMEPWATHQAQAKRRLVWRCAFQATSSNNEPQVSLQLEARIEMLS